MMRDDLLKEYSNNSINLWKYVMDLKIMNEGNRMYDSLVVYDENQLEEFENN